MFHFHTTKLWALIVDKDVKIKHSCFCLTLNRWFSSYLYSEGFAIFRSLPVTLKAYFLELWSGTKAYATNHVKFARECRNLHTCQHHLKFNYHITEIPMDLPYFYNTHLYFIRLILKLWEYIYALMLVHPLLTTPVMYEMLFINPSHPIWYTCTVFDIWFSSETITGNKFNWILWFSWGKIN